MAVSDDLRSRVLATHHQLESEKRPCGTPHIVHYLRFEHPVALSDEDENAIFDAGWRAEVGRILRGIATSEGNRTMQSVPGEHGRSYKQLSFMVLTDALGVLQTYESGEHAYRVQRQGWWLICSRLRELDTGATVADLFPSEERWDKFWQGIRDSDLWTQAA